MTWFKDSVEIQEDRLSFNNVGDNYSLVIPYLSFSDSGNYTCEAENSYGKSSKSFQVEVYYDTDFNNTNNLNHIVEEGSTIELSCEIDEYPQGY